MAKKRKAASSTSNAKKDKKQRSSSSSSNNNMLRSKKKKSSSGAASGGGGHDESAVEEMFHEIADDASDSSSLVTMEGIAELGSKLGIDVTEDIRILVLLWKMECCKEKNGCITATEWKAGCERLQVDSWEALKGKLPGCELGFLENRQFKDFYKFCFRFNLAGTHKTLDKELVVALLGMLLGDGERVPRDRTESFCHFLEGKDHYEKITLDQWTSFLDFSFEVTDLENYDESTSAWPVMLDEYVEFMEERRRS